MIYTIRDLHASNPDDYVEGSHDVLATYRNGVTLYSPDYFDSLRAAEEFRTALTPEDESKLRFEGWEPLEAIA